MKISRRDFIRTSFPLGQLPASLPESPNAKQKKEGEWRPAYEKLEKEGKLAQRVKQAYCRLRKLPALPPAVRGESAKR